MNYVPYLYDRIIPLLLTNNSRINGPESKRDSGQTLLMNQSNKSISKKLLYDMISNRQRLNTSKIHNDTTKECY